MDHFPDLLRVQYDLARDSRGELLKFCGRLALEEFVLENSAFGRGSVRNLLTHIGNTYLYWIGEVCLGRDMTYAEYNSIPDLMGILRHFDLVDRVMGSFLAESGDLGLREATFQLNGSPGKASFLKIFTHTLSHEFHHKGQILSLCRHLGYIPVDTDIMR
ncbi:MAG TPA: DinB family protein [Calditrichia bacterium]|nr:damage-inducible protein DinB [Calditrichota bacterium]HQU74759.1 DinB family protein [Calditrichia bacterium]HQV33558.1 DinB family protein [Calditrichia bacterium]